MPVTGMGLNFLDVLASESEIENWKSKGVDRVYNISIILGGGGDSDQCLVHN
jgi:hypothetical protein